MATTDKLTYILTSYNGINYELRVDVTQYPESNYSCITPSLWLAGTCTKSGGMTLYCSDIGYGKITRLDTNGTAISTINPGCNNLDGDVIFNEGEYKQQQIASWNTSLKSYKWYHNTDGTLQLKVNCGVSLYVKNSNELYTSAFEKITLRAISNGLDILTAPNFNDEENPSFTYEAKNTITGYDGQALISSFGVSNMQAALSFNGYTDHIAWRDININATSYTFELTDAEREILRENVQGSTMKPIYFLFKTIRSGTGNDNQTHTTTYIATKEKTIQIINCRPEITTTLEDVNANTVALTGDSSTIVKYFSDVRASMNMWTKKGATISGFYIKNGTNKVEEYAHTFEDVSYNSFDFFVIDSRNQYKQKTVTPKMVEYVKLTCNLKDNKPDTEGKLTVECSGNYFNDSFGAVINALMVQYRYKLQDGVFSEWRNMAITYSGDTYEATAELNDLDYQATYVFETKATDLLMSVSSGENAVKSLPVFHWSKEDFVHETPVKFNDVIEGDVQITGNLRLKADGSNYGNKLYFGDSSYAFIGEDSDDKLTIDATKLILSAQNISLSSQTDIFGGLTLNGGSIAFGTFTPTLNTSAAVSSYDVRYGWYLKLGSCVVIGFNIKANCYSGYNSTALSIGGVPFTPDVTAFGGGVAYNIYISGGFNFEGWAIDTSGNITARLQPCNNTSSGNLNISSTAGYPSGGGQVTLGGTICFTTTL